MFSTEKKLLSAFCASVFTLSAMAAATTVIEQPFATTGDLTVDAYKANWSGNGTVEGLETAPTVTVGKPIAEATDKNVLCVQGTVQCAAATAEKKPATVDMMIQIARPDDALELPSGEGETAQIAVGVDADGKLNVYCKDKQGKAAWHRLGNTAYTEGSWHRMSLTFDYTKNTCQIRLDGEPLMTANGYLTSDPAGASAGTGSWYKLNTTTVQKISSLKVVGSTAIDEVVVKYGEGLGEVQPPLADGEDKTGGVPNAWLAEQGITREMATGNAPDGSNMTVADKYKAGFNVADGKKLEITKMAVKTEGVELTVPVAQSPDGYKNVIEVKNGETIVQTKDIASGTDTVTAVVPTVQDGKAVKYTYQIKTQTTK